MGQSVNIPVPIFIGTFFVMIIIEIYCHQTQYRFIHERCEVIEVNKSLATVHFGKCTRRRGNYLHMDLNFTTHVDIMNNNDAQFLVIGYQFRSNEYRKGPIEFTMGMCSMVTTEQFDIPNMFSNSNLKKCPFRKGEYYIFNIKPNATNMPPFIPEGRWLLQINIIYRNKYQAVAVNWYAGVEYPVLIPKH